MNSRDDYQDYGYVGFNKRLRFNSIAINLRLRKARGLACFRRDMRFRFHFQSLSRVNTARTALYEFSNQSLLS